MNKFVCTGCEDFFVERDKIGYPQEPCPNCGYLGEGKYGSGAEQYERLEE